MLPKRHVTFHLKAASRTPPLFEDINIEEMIANLVFRLKNQDVGEWPWFFDNLALLLWNVHEIKLTYCFPYGWDGVV